MLRLAPWKVGSILLVIILAVLLLVPSFLSNETVSRLQKSLPVGLSASATPSDEISKISPAFK